MNLFLSTLLIFTTYSVFAKSPVIDFTQALNQDVKNDIRKDEEKFKRPVRGPASLKAEPVSQAEETSKIDKNVRQIGPNKW